MRPGEEVVGRAAMGGRTRYCRTRGRAAASSRLPTSANCTGGGPHVRRRDRNEGALGQPGGRGRGAILPSHALRHIHDVIPPTLPFNARSSSSCREASLAAPDGFSETARLRLLGTSLDKPCPPASLEQRRRRTVKEAGSRKASEKARHAFTGSTASMSASVMGLNTRKRASQAAGLRGSRSAFPRLFPDLRRACVCNLCRRAKGRACWALERKQPQESPPAKPCDP